MEHQVTVFVLWDPRQPNEEWGKTAWELERQQISCEIGQCRVFSPIYNTVSVEQSINLSHKNMVSTAKGMALPEVCILESDCMFPDPFGWEYFLSLKPARYDLYLGGVYGLGLPDRDHLEPGVIRLSSWEGMHCYFIHERFYDRFLSLPDEQHIDVALTGQGNFFVVYPFAAIQRPGWSATSKKENVDYNTLLKKADVYGW